MLSYNLIHVFTNQSEPNQSSSIPTNQDSAFWITQTVTIWSPHLHEKETTVGEGGGWRKGSSLYKPASVLSWWGPHPFSIRDCGSLAGPATSTGAATLELSYYPGAVNTQTSVSRLPCLGPADYIVIELFSLNIISPLATPPNWGLLLALHWWCQIFVDTSKRINIYQVLKAIVPRTLERNSVEVKKKIVFKKWYF